jgi:hypothetical protein
MADQNGVYSRPYNWENEAAAGDGIDPVKFDADGDQVAAALNKRLPSDGSRAASADIPMGGHTLTGLRAGAASGEPVTFDQIQGATTFAYCVAVLGL